MQKIEESFRRMYGTPCWGVSWHPQLNLSMNFGQPHLEIREPGQSEATSERVRQMFSYRNVTVRGEWWLWISCAFWKLSLRDMDPVTGASSTRRIEQTLARLDGQRLEHVMVNPHTAATTFTFDLGGILEVRRRPGEVELDLWTLYKPSGYALAIRGDGQYSHERTNHQERWRPIARIR